MTQQEALEKLSLQPSPNIVGAFGDCYVLPKKALHAFIDRERKAFAVSELRKLRDEWSYLGTAGGSGTAQAVLIKKFDQAINALEANE